MKEVVKYLKYLFICPYEMFKIINVRNNMQKYTRQMKQLKGISHIQDRHALDLSSIVLILVELCYSTLLR